MFCHKQETGKEEVLLQFVQNKQTADMEVKTQEGVGDYNINSVLCRELILGEFAKSTWPHHNKVCCLQLHQLISGPY